MAKRERKTPPLSDEEVTQTLGGPDSLTLPGIRRALYQVMRLVLVDKLDARRANSCIQALNTATRTHATDSEILERNRKWVTGLSDEELAAALAKIRRRHQVVEMAAEVIERRKEDAGKRGLS